MKILDADDVNLTFKYFHFLATLFVLLFVFSNILAVKIADVYGFQTAGGIVTFPLSYIFSDILTEVYGFQRARQLIWFAIFCEILVIIFSKIAISLPPSSYWMHQNAFSIVLGPEWRIVMASCISYLVGDFTNCSVISKLKLKFGKRYMSLRFISSTAIGVLVDNALFTLLAFTGILPYKTIARLITDQYILKVIYETIMSPFSVRICTWLKKQECVDIYDVNTKFEIFKLKIEESLHKNLYDATK